jgi:SAM-dependent methyltransferase
MRSDIEWKEWGRVDPLFGVASLDGRSKRGPKPWTDEEFYEHGKACWAQYLPYWERYGLTRGLCVEIGCGAGRLTKVLAESFQSVHALDVSEDMIVKARTAVPTNVTFQLTADPRIDLPDGSADASFSTDVFQHFPSPEDGAAYFRELARVLRPGATMMHHVPVHTWPHPPGAYRGLHAIHRLLTQARDGIQRMVIILGGRRPFMTGITYENLWLFDTLKTLGFARIELLVFSTPGNRCYVFATRTR